MRTDKSKPTRRRPKTARILSPPDHRTIQARRLDLAADCLLQAGHRAAAETLAWRAAAMREAVQ